MSFLAKIAIVVRDYDEAIAYYKAVLQWHLYEDTRLDANKRWVVMGPPPPLPPGACSLLLARAANQQQEAAIGNQSGGRVFLFLYTTNLQKDLERLRALDVQIVRPMRQEAYGKVVVFEDLYGNLWDLIEPNE